MGRIQTWLRSKQQQQQQQQQHSLSIPSKLGQARVETHQEPQVMVQALQQPLSKHSYSNIDLKVCPKLSNLFLLPSPCQFRSSSTSPHIISLAYDSTMHWCLWRSPLDMVKPSQLMVDKLFFDWCYPQAITYIMVPNSVHSCVTTNPSQQNCISLY